MNENYWPFGRWSELVTLTVSIGLNTILMITLVTFANVGYTADSLPDAIVAQSDLGSTSLPVIKDFLVTLENPISIWFYQNQSWISTAWTEAVFLTVPVLIYATAILWTYHRVAKSLYSSWRVENEVA